MKRLFLFVTWFCNYRACFSTQHPMHRLKLFFGLTWELNASLCLASRNHRTHRVWCLCLKQSAALIIGFDDIIHDSQLLWKTRIDMFIAIYKYSNFKHCNRIVGQQESEFQFQECVCMDCLCANQCFLFAIQPYENIVDHTFLYLFSPEAWCRLIMKRHDLISWI